MTHKPTTQLIQKIANLLVIAALLLMAVAIPGSNARAASPLTHTVSLGTPAAANTNADTLNFTVTFSEGVSGVDATDFSVNSASTATITLVTPVTASVYTFTVSGGNLASYEGSVGLNIAGGSDIIAISDSTPITASEPALPADDQTYTLDNTAPVLTISTTESDPTNSSPFVVTFSFTEDVTGFDGTDISTTNVSGGLLNIIDAATYYSDIIPAADGSVTFDVVAGAAQDAAGNNSTSDSFSIVYDGTAPGVAISSLEADPTNISPFSISIAFDEDVTGFDVSDLAVTNGTAGNFATTDAANYTADITPTADGVVDVDIASAAATDPAGNNNTAATTFSIEYDSTAPNVAITSLETSPTNANPIAVTVTFDEIVTGFDVSDLAVTNGTAGNFVNVDGAEYTANITPAADGSVDVDIASAAAADPAGNDSNAAATFSIDYDGTAPTVAISSAALDPINSGVIPLDITFSEDVTGFDITDIVVTNGTAANFVAIDGANYTVDVDPTHTGLVDVDIAAASAQDIAGNDNDAAITYSHGYEITTSITSAETDPTNEKDFIITINFSDTVTGFDLADLVLTNATGDLFVNVDGMEYTFEIDPVADGLVQVDLPLDVTNEGNNDALYSITYDGTDPVPSLSSAITSPTNDVSFGVQVTWSEDVYAFMLSDIQVTNGHAGAFSGSGDSYSFTLTPSGNGLVTVTIPAPAAHDLAGNHNSEEAVFSITFDDTEPTVAISNPSAGHLAITFSESVSGFALADITSTNAAVSNLAGSGASYTADYTVPAAGPSTFAIAAGVASDAAGNLNLASSTLTINNDSTAPSVVSIIRADASPTKAASVRYTVTFSENVKNVDAADFALATTGSLSATSISAITGSNAVYTVSVNTGTGSGTIGLNIVSGNNIADLSNNALGVAYTGTNLYTIDRVVPTVTGNSLALAAGAPLNSFTITFGEDVYDPAGNSNADDVTNPANYLLVNAGANRYYDTPSCQAGVKIDDLKITVNSVAYNAATRMATVSINNGANLPTGSYRLFICGTTSIVDLAGNPLNGGQDATVDFSVMQQYPGMPHFPPHLPHTGFGMLAAQPAPGNYAPSGASLSIPSLGLTLSIVDVALQNGEWDLDGLGNNIGLLGEGAALGSNGNAILTGHIYNAGNIPGPFIALKSVKVGENISVNAGGKLYTYAVRSSELVDSDDLEAVFVSESDPWLTLVTCETYNASSDSYSQRRVVRAELVSVK